MRDLKLKFADFLFKYFFFLYQPLYFFYKKKRDLLEITYYKKYIKPGNVVLDIGGNIGFTTSIFSKLVEPNGKVISFEPDKINFKHLSNLVKGKKLKNVDLVNKAVSINSKPTNIYLSNRLGVDHRTYKPKNYDSVYEIPAISIDEFLGDNKKVDFIKIDIQGFEMTAIKGMLETLSANPDLVVLSEFWPEGLRQAGRSVEDYYNYLIKKKYNVYLIKKKGLVLLDNEKIKMISSYKGDKCENILFKKNK